MNNGPKPCGVLLCVVHNGSEHYIGMDVMGTRVTMSQAYAGHLFEVLGDLLESIGYFDTEDGVTCH